MGNRMLLASLLACLTLAGAEDNALSADERAAGYDLLFNGIDLHGWHGYRRDTAPSGWSVRTDLPLGPRIQNGNGEKLYLLSDRKYQNFDLKFDAQTPINGESGVHIRFEETATTPYDHISGPLFQICGPYNVDCVMDTHHFGSCYDMFAPIASLRETWPNPPGTWNRIRIVAFDSDIVHYGNGKKLLEYRIGSPEFLDAYSKSKYSNDGNNGRYYDIHPGGFALQHRGDTGIAYRNIKAKELSAHPFLREFQATGKWPDSLPQDFAFGLAASGIPVRDREKPSGIHASALASGSLLIEAGNDLDGFEAWNLEGRALPYRKLSDKAYLVERGEGAAGVILIRLKANGRIYPKRIGPF